MTMRHLCSLLARPVAGSRVAVSSFFAAVIGIAIFAVASTGPANAMVIASGHANATLVSRFLSLRPLVLVGLMSYSIYLWHWPIIVFFKYRFGLLFEQHPAPSIAAVFAASLGIGYLSWQWVETPFRRPSAPSRRRTVFVALAGVTLLMTLASLHTRSCSCL